MRIEVYQLGKKVTDIDLSADHPAEVCLISNRNMHLTRSPEGKVQVLKVTEGDAHNEQDDRSR